MAANIDACAVIVSSKDKLSVEFLNETGEKMTCYFNSRRPAYVPWHQYFERLLMGHTNSESISKEYITSREDECGPGRLSLLDTSITICIVMKVTVPGPEYAGEVLDADAELVKQVERVKMAEEKMTPQ